MAVLLSAASWAAPLAAEQRAQRVQRGLASFYSGKFDGQETASGTTFDQRELVAAHPTLPFGTLIRVTNVKNGRSVKVRVVDRGPYGKNRRKGTILDLSRAAARRLRMVEDGLVPIRLQVLRLPPPDESGNEYNDRR